jgi:hypothetical protein
VSHTRTQFLSGISHQHVIPRLDKSPAKAGAFAEQRFMTATTVIATGMSFRIEFNKPEDSGSLLYFAREV